jgi:hypothetical protein
MYAARAGFWQRNRCSACTCRVQGPQHAVSRVGTLISSSLSPLVLCIRRLGAASCRQLFSMDDPVARCRAQKLWTTRDEAQDMHMSPRLVTHGIAPSPTTSEYLYTHLFVFHIVIP